jgi:hypothetical protein
VTGLVPALWVGVAVIAFASFLLAAVPWRSGASVAVASTAAAVN